MIATLQKAACVFVLLAFIVGSQAQSGPTEAPNEGVTVEFERQYYSVLENQYVTICVIIRGVVTQEFTLNIHYVSKDPFLRFYEERVIEVSVEVFRLVCFSAHIVDDFYFNLLEREIQVELQAPPEIGFGELYPAWLIAVDRSVVEIGFSQDTYTAFEGEQVHVCVEYFSSFYIGAPIVFRVESFGQSFGDSVAMKGFGDAEAGVDYANVNEIATIASGGVQGALGCIYIDVFDDGILEDPEYFSVHIIIFDYRVIVTRQYALIKIIDNDVKFRFIDNTPLVDLTTVHLVLCIDPQPVYATCTVSRAIDPVTGERNETQDCTNGRAYFTLPDGTRPHDINVTALFPNGEVRVIDDRRVRAETDRDTCWAHLINYGVTTNETHATVEFQGTGPAANSPPRIQDYECELYGGECDDGNLGGRTVLDTPDCSAPSLTIGALAAGDYCLSIRPIDAGCRRQLRLPVDFSISGTGMPQ